MVRSAAEPGPRPALRFRSAVGPLLLYHVLILLGGAMILVAVLHGPPALLVPGVVILIAGVSTVVAVLAWTARLAREAALAHGATASSGDRARWVCTRCAYASSRVGAICPKCGGWLIRRSGEPERPPATGPL